MKEKHLQTIRIAIVLGIAIIGGMIRLFHLRMDPMISRDGVIYFQQCLLLIDNGYNALIHTDYFYTPPFFIWLVSILSKNGIPIEASGISINIIAGSILVIIAYGLGKAIFLKYSKGCIFALLAAFHPTLIKLSTEFQRESLFLLFSGLLILTVIKYSFYQQSYYLILAGCISALALLTRFESLILVLSAFLTIIYICWNKPARKTIVLKDLLNYALSFSISYFLLCWIIMGNIDYFSIIILKRINFLLT